MAFQDDVPQQTRPGYNIGCYALVALILVLLRKLETPMAQGDSSQKREERTKSKQRKKEDMKSEKKDSTEQKVDTTQGSSRSEVIISGSYINKLHVSVNSHTTQSGLDDGHVNMEAVVAETYSFDWKRFAMLMLLGFMIFTQFVIMRQMQKQESNIFGSFLSTKQCAGVLEPSGVIRVSYAFSSIMFALMNYAIILPICLEELTLERQKYAGLVFKAKFLLFIFYSVFPFLVNCSLGDSTPVIFFRAYGRTIYGILFCVFALLLTIIGMQLRIMICVKLIEVLFGDANSKSRHWIVIILLFFTSFLLSESFDEMQLIIIMGLFTNSILLVILPRIAYIQFRMKKIAENERYIFISPMFCILHALYVFVDYVELFMTLALHALLFMTIIWAFKETNFDVEDCRQFSSEYSRSLIH